MSNAVIGAEVPLFIHTELLDEGEDDVLGEQARRGEYLRRVRHLARVDDEGEAVGVERRLEAIV